MESARDCQPRSPPAFHSRGQGKRDWHRAQGRPKRMLESGTHLTHPAGSRPSWSPTRLSLGGIFASPRVQGQCRGDFRLGRGRWPHLLPWAWPRSVLCQALPVLFPLHSTPLGLRHPSSPLELGLLLQEGLLASCPCLPPTAGSWPHTAALLGPFLAVNKSSLLGLGPVWAQAFPAGSHLFMSSTLKSWHGVTV